MDSHNPIKRLKNLESLLKETLTKEQQEELEVLKSMKKNMDDHDEKCKERFGYTPAYYDRKGKPMSLWEWSSYSSDIGYKIIDQNTYGDFFVSTIWLGLDHAFPPTAASPIIFETMIFVKREREHELGGYMERYATEKDAVKGHIEACKLANSASMSDLKGKFKYFNEELKKSIDDEV